MTQWASIHRVRGHVATWCAAGALIAVGMACDGLWVGDTPRPTLKCDDHFSVSPACPELVVDSTAIASVEPTVTITARRSETQLGAESVPVDVSIGSCGSNPDAGVESGTADQDAGGTSGVVRHCPTDTLATCSQGFSVMDPATAANFELVADPGCQQASSSQLSCTLDPSGQATFRIRSLDTTSPALLAEYLPICVRPAMDRDGASFDTEIRVVPREGTARFASAVAKLSDVAPTPPAGTSCDSLIASCGTKIPRARLQAGIVSADAPDPAREADFLPVQRDLTISVAMDAQTVPAFLSMDPTCAQPDGGNGLSLPSLTIPHGQRESATFFLCAAPKTGSFRITATVSGAATDGGAPTSSSALETRPLEFEEPALVQGYSVDDEQHILSKATCDGTKSPATGTDFNAITPPQQGGSNGTIVVGSCEASTAQGDAGADAGGDAGEAGSGSCGVTLTLASGGTCTL